jgi:hypothetical protein
VADVEAVRKAILDHILFVLRVVDMRVGEQAKAVNDLAEAWAWLGNANQPHGGSAIVPPDLLSHLADEGTAEQRQSAQR